MRLTEEDIRGYAREIADALIAGVRNSEGEVVRIPGNQYAPPLRAIPLADSVWTCDNEDALDLWELLVSEIENHLSREGMRMQAQDQPSTLYVATLRRWEYPDQPDPDSEWENES